MPFVAGNSLIATSSLPELRWIHLGTVNGPNLQGQQQAKAKDGFPTIGFLAAFFTGKGRDSRGLMNDLNSRFDLVAMLAAGTRVASSSHKTLFQELVFGKTAGMNRRDGRISHARELLMNWMVAEL